jgi:ABC-type uncharacterized transport system involved in gliding motility auxiliary subunit
MAMRVPRRTLTILAAVLGLIGLLVAGAVFLVRQQAQAAVYVGLVVAVGGFVGAMLLGREGLVRAAQGRQARYGLNALLAVGALLGILILINVVAFQNPKSWDLTEDRQYSLAPETIAALTALDSDVRLIGFYSPERADSRDALRPLLQQYEEESDGRVSVEFIDPREQPFLAQEYGVTRDATLIVAMGTASEVTPFASEQEITGAIVRLANPGSRSVYFLTGHGERDPQASDELGYDQMRQALEAKNYIVQDLSLLITPQVPDDALAVVIAGPTAPLSEAEVDALEAYLEEGGGLVVLADPMPVAAEGEADDPLASFLNSAWGLDLRNDLIVDLSSSMPLAAIAASYATHPVTDRLQSLATYFPTARSVVVEPPSEAISRGELILTGTNSWGETDLAGMSQEETSIEFNGDADTPGPLAVGATAEDLEGGARLVVIGDSDFGSNAIFYDLGNGDLLVNSVDWAAGQDELISLTPKETTERFVTPPSRQVLLLVFMVSVVAIPALFLILGLTTWWGRRSKA